MSTLITIVLTIFGLSVLFAMVFVFWLMWSVWYLTKDGPADPAPQSQRQRTLAFHLDRACYAWHYWRAGMTLRNAWVVARTWAAVRRVP